MVDRGDRKSAECAEKGVTENAKTYRRKISEEQGDITKGRTCADQVFRTVVKNVQTKGKKFMLHSWI